MTTWNDFRNDYFSSDELNYIDQIISIVQSKYPTSFTSGRFSDMVTISERDVQEALATQNNLNALNTHFATFFLSKKDEVSSGGTNAEKWESFKKLFDYDYHDAINILVDEIRLPGNGYDSFDTFKNSATPASIAAIMAAKSRHWFFYQLLGTLFAGRVKRATDGYNVLENQVDASERNAYIKLLDRFYDLPDYDVFEKIRLADRDTLAKNLYIYFQLYPWSSSGYGNSEYLNALIRLFILRIREFSSGNRSVEELYESVLGSFRPDLKNAFSSLYAAIRETGAINEFDELINFPHFTGYIHGEVISGEAEFGFQLQPNPRFEEGVKGWYRGPGGLPIYPELIHDGAFRITENALFSSHVLQSGQTYQVEFDVVRISSVSAMTIQNGSEAIDIDISLGHYTRTIVADASNLTFFRKTGSGYFDISNIEIRQERALPSPGVYVEQEVSASQGKIYRLELLGLTEDSNWSDQYWLALEDSSEIIKIPKTTSDDKVALANAINLEASDSESEWFGYSASVVSDILTVTGPIGIDFDLRWIGIRSILLQLPSSHDFYKFLASDILTIAQKANESIGYKFSLSGQLVNLSVNGKIPAFLRINLRDMDAKPEPVSIGSEFTTAEGFFQFNYEITSPYNAIRQFEVEVFDGVSIAKQYFSHTVGDQETVVISIPYYPPGASDSNISIQTVVDTISLVLPSGFMSYLNAKSIRLLKDIRAAGGLAFLEDLPVSPDDPAVVTLDAHASLNLVSTNILSNQAMIEEGYTTPLAIGQATRSEMVTIQEANNVGSFNASSVYYISRSYGALLQSLISGHLTSKANNYVPGQLSDELDPVFEEACICQDCNTAVSPLAYLTDLINYTLAHVRNNNQAIDINFLETTFYQELSDLPYLCGQTEELVCQQRLAIEVMRRYLNARTLAPEKYAQLAEDTAQYCFSVYRTLLTQLGTSYEQIRSYRFADFEMRQELANRLHFPISEEFDPFEFLFLEQDALLEENRLNEANLEKLFGFVDSTRDPFSTGVLFGDQDQLVIRWIFKGVKHRQNTDENGFIYLKVSDSPNEVYLYNDVTRQSASLIGIATESGRPGVLQITPLNESELSGELYLDSYTDTSSIYVSVLPMVLCWRLSRNREQWLQSDWPANPYLDRELPIIDPDIIGPDDFRKPDPDQNDAFKVWKNRREWVDGLLTLFEDEQPQVSAMVDLLAEEFTYTRLDSQSLVVRCWSTVKTFEDLQAIYRKLKSSQRSENEEAQNEITDLYLSTESFVRLYQLYNKTVVNDSKGLIVRLHQAASAGSPQITHLIPAVVRAGDRFVLSMPGKADIEYEATSDLLIDLLEGLEPEFAARSWDIEAEVSSGGEYLILTGEVNTPFTVKTKTCRVPEDGELKELVSILAQAVKTRFYDFWISEEQNVLALSLDNLTFWPATYSPLVGFWGPHPVSTPAVPLIDPGQVNFEDIAGYYIAEEARTLYKDRQEILQSSYSMLNGVFVSDGFESLLETALGSSYLGPYDSLDTLLFDLEQTADPQKSADAETYITDDLHISTDEFRYLMQFREKNNDPNASAMSSDEINSLVSILAKAYKINELNPDWINEEDTADFTYWQIFRLALPQWRSSRQGRAVWEKALALSMRTPAIEPDYIRPDFLKSIDNGSAAFVLWKQRKQAIDYLLESIRDTRETHAQSGTDLEAFDLIVNNYIVATSNSGRLRILYEAAQAGEDVLGEIRQLNLSYEALEYLMVIRDVLSEGGTSVLAEEWEAVYSILARAGKERQYYSWLREEQTAAITLSPDFFRVSGYARDTFMKLRDQAIVSWRVNLQRKRDWLDKLEARISSDDNQHTFVSEIVDRTEENALFALRDALIRASLVFNETFEDKRTYLTKKLLIDMKNNCCQKTTRIAQGMEALQLMLFSIRTGLLADEYPKLKIFSDYFDNEWEWIGSYATWRSAMFIQLYPENVLHPSFKKRTSGAFQEIVSAVQNDQRFNPEGAVQLADEYFSYLRDLKGIKLVAHAGAVTALGDSFDKAGNEITEVRQFIFGMSDASKRLYWTVFDGEDTANFSPRPWNKVDAFDLIVNPSVIGTTLWSPGQSGSFLLLFVKGFKDGKELILYTKFDLNTGYWDPTAVEMEIPPEENNSTKKDRFSGKLTKIKLNKVPPGTLTNEVKFVVHRGEDVRFFKLNDGGSDLEKISDPQNYNQYYIKEIYDYIGGRIIAKADAKSSSSIRTLKEELYRVRVTDKKKSVVYDNVTNIKTTDLWVSATKYELTIKNQKNTIKVKKDDSVIEDVSIYDYESTTTSSQVSIIGGSIASSGASLFNIYIDSMIWNSGSNGNSAQCFLFYRDSINGPVYYRVFNYSTGKIENLAKKADSTFVADFSFISLFEDRRGLTFAIYNKTTGQKDIQITPIYKSDVEYKVSLLGRVRTNNILSIDPRSHTIPLSYNLSGIDTIAPDSDPQILSSTTKNFYTSNQALPESFFNVIAEGYYFMPMLLGLALQNKGYYKEALDWFRLVYSYDYPDWGDKRKIWYGLIAEKSYVGDIKRVEDWMNDPLDPHAIAQTRALSYTRFTILSIVKCMQEFADSEFTKDNAESVPRARALYEASLELLDAEGLYSKKTNCSSQIENLRIPAAVQQSADWSYWQPVWLEIVMDLYRIEDKAVLDNTIALISLELEQSTGLADKFSNIRDLVDDALITPEDFEDFAGLLGSGRVMNEKALRRLLSNSGIEQGTRFLASEVGKYYLNAVASATGIVATALLSDDMSLPWFASEPKIDVEAIPASITDLTGSQPLSPYFVRARAAYNRVNPTSEQIETLRVINNPITVINKYYGKNVHYMPQLNPVFCVPANPILRSYIFSAEANLFKIRNCMNIAGIVRELQPYAAPTDQSTGMPVLGPNGISLGSNIQNFNPSIYRFEVLIERARQQVSMAQQLESTLLSLYEKGDSENYNLLKARQDMQLAKAGVRLHELRLKEAESNIVLTELQRDRIAQTTDHYKELIDNGLISHELMAMSLLFAANQLMTVNQILYMGASIAALTSGTTPATVGAATAQSLGFLAGSVSSQAQQFGNDSSIQSMLASFERRKEEWQFQYLLSQQDLLIAGQEIRVAQQRKQVVEQERNIAQMQADQATETLEYLSRKFTNAELYEWMSNILEKVYSYFLYQATATAKVAQNQLTFERQEQVPSFIKDDYWEAPSQVGLSIGGGGGIDRRGLTASARLLQNITELDQYAFDSEKRKLQLTRNISLMRMAPTDFQRFRESGRMEFTLPMELFDRDFPGHYLRMIKRVRATIVALTPPVDGIKATLRSSGISYIVNGTDYRKNYILRQPESVSLSSPYQASGLFELQEQSSRLYPFENMGVESTWELILPKAANFFDFNTIADVIFTIEYTALENGTYRNEVIQRLNNRFEGDRPFSFKNNFADQWYDFSNPDQKNKSVTVRFNTTRFDFPVNLSEMRVTAVSLFFATASDSVRLNGNVGLSYGPEGEEQPGATILGATKDMSTRAQASAWNTLIEGKSPVGSWELSLDGALINLILGEQITDILFVVSIKGDTPEWPTY